MKGLMTCFEDFSNVSENTSRLIVEGMSAPYKILPVTFEGCDRDIPDNLDFLILVGVAASRSKITVERFAHNLNHSPIQPDNNGHKPIHEQIDTAGAVALTTSIPPQLIDPIEGSWEWSTSAGSYVCNALYYKCLRRFPRTKTIFVHVPHDNSQIALKNGRDFLQKLMQILERYTQNSNE